MHSHVRITVDNAIVLSTRCRQAFKVCSLYLDTRVTGRHWYLGRTSCFGRVTLHRILQSSALPRLRSCAERFYPRALPFRGLGPMRNASVMNSGLLKLRSYAERFCPRALLFQDLGPMRNASVHEIWSSEAKVLCETLLSKSAAFSRLTSYPECIC